MKNFIISSIFFAVNLSCIQLVQAQNEQKVEKAQSNNAVVTIIPYNFKAQTLQGKVDEAMEEGKQDNAGPIYQLMQTYKDDSSKILRLVKRYAQDPDEEVRLTVLDAVSIAPFEQTSMDIIVSIIPDESIGHRAIDIIYKKLDEDQIIEKGGETLKRALFKGAFNSRYTTRGYILLSCYKNDNSTINFLKRRRLSLLDPDKIDERISLDLALSKMGDRSAVERINEIILGGSVPEILSFLRYLKFIDNRDILLISIEILRKTTQANKVFSVDGKLLASSRLCDEAMVALFEKDKLNTNKSSQYDGIAPQFSDFEIKQAYEKLRSDFTSITVR